MLNPLDLSVSRSDLLEADDWGDGYCLSCGERVHGAEDSTLSECSCCGQILVMSGGDLLRLAKKLAPCASPYPNSI